MKQKDSISSTCVVVFSIKHPPAALFMIVSSIDAQPTNNSELNRRPTHKQQSQHQKTVNADLILSMTFTLSMLKSLLPVGTVGTRL